MILKINWHINFLPKLSVFIKQKNYLTREEIMKLKINSILSALLLGGSVFLSIGANAQCVDQVPILSGDVANVTTSGNYDSSYMGWQAFDADQSSMWISEVYETPVWIAYAFDTQKTVTRYSINYKNGSITTRAPKNWELQGSSGGVWVTLDSRSNEINWAGSERRSYAVSNPGAYTNYRLLVTDDNDDREGIVVISMGDLSLETCGCNFDAEQVPVLTGNTSAVSTSGVYSSSYPAWQVFDAPLSTMWISAVFQTPAWIGYEWSSPRFIKQYSITYKNGSITSRAPKDWALQGWTGSSWTNVDIRTNQVGWLGSETRHYTVTTPGSYKKYRLQVTDDNDARTGIVVISMGGLSLKGCAL
jgi:hypothetical protein